MKQSVKQLIRVTALVPMMAVVLTACSESMEDLNKYISSVKERPADPIPPIPPVRTYTPYEYSGVVGRDPFRASLNEGSDDVRSSSKSAWRPLMEINSRCLERYELDTMAMVGTFRKEKSYWALIPDPAGEVHRVPVGDFIGKNHGQVVLISDTEVSLSELISDGAGGWLVREASIALGEG